MLCLLSWTNAVRCPFCKYPFFSARRCTRRTVRQSAQPVAPTPHLATGHQVSHRFRQLGLQWRDAYLCLNQWTCLLHCEFRAKVEPIHAWVTRAQKILTLWHCDCVIVTVKQRACSEIHTNTQNRGHPVNQVGIIDNKKWHGRVRRRKTLGYSNDTQAYIHGFLTAYHINIFMLLCTKNFAERVGRRCCFSWNVYAVFTLHPANFSKVWADLEKVTSNSVA